MPRAARKKSEEAMYHVMSRSLSEIDLFRSDQDKDYYLMLLKRYKEKYLCRIYSFILMDNHVHIYINPCGADISTFMHSLNTAYVSYYNRKYNRHGHLFQGRFASKIVNNNTYSLTLSAYIHNNAKDLPYYDGKEELYPYSSYGIYLGCRGNKDGLVDTEYILNLFGGTQASGQRKYKTFVESMKNAGIMKEVDENIMVAYTENKYVSEKHYVIRDKTPDEILNKIAETLGEEIPEELRLKYSREASDIRAFTIYALRILCGYTYSELCKYIGNMSMSGISRLSKKGFTLYKEHKKYKNVFNSLIQAA